MYTNYFSPSKTAITTALARAVHQILDEPIVLKDANAQLLLDEGIQLQLINDPYAFNDPMARTMRAAIIARNSVVHDALYEAKKKNSDLKQFIMLGCGLDAFSLNHASIYNDIEFYDIDTPAMIHWRKTRINDANILLPCNIHQVSCDLNNQELFEILSSFDFKKNKPVFISFMGVSPYLKNDIIYGVMERFATLPKGSSIHFDYRVKHSLLDSIEQMMDQVVAQQVSIMGEPWLSEFLPDELSIDLLKMGFTRVNHFNTENLNSLYFSKRKDGLQTAGGGLRLISAFVD